MGGIRKGLELAAKELGFNTQCVFTSEIKDAAIKVLKQNHPEEAIVGDITKIEPSSIPDFDILLGGFPCQAFSSAGKGLGFADTRGTLFFNVANILEIKKPIGFILENVEGLVTHDKGRTLKVIINTLYELGYNVSYKVLNSKYFGVAQERKRIYIVGIRGLNSKKISLDNFPKSETTLHNILEANKPLNNSKFIDLSHDIPLSLQVGQVYKISE